MAVPHAQAIRCPKERQYVTVAVPIVSTADIPEGPDESEEGTMNSNCLHGVLGLGAAGLLLFGCSPEPRYKTLPASYWLKQIRDPDAANRFHAAYALGEMGPSVNGSLPALI